MGAHVLSRRVAKASPSRGRGDGDRRDVTSRGLPARFLDRTVQVRGISCYCGVSLRYRLVLGMMADVKHFDVDATLDSIVAVFWRNGMAATGIQNIVEITGLNRSSLYSTFGNKQRMYVAALRRYIDTWATPVLAHVRDSERGIPAIIDFFDGLIALRCSGSFAGWGCMVTNAHAGVESDDPDIQAILNGHHQQLRHALSAALDVGRKNRQLPPTADVDGSADLLVSLTYAINLRSRTDADPTVQRRAAGNVLKSIGCDY